MRVAPTRHGEGGEMRIPLPHTQSLPLEGKVPNASEADEVGRALLLQLNCEG